LEEVEEGTLQVWTGALFFAEELFSWVVVEPLTIALFVGLLCVDLGRAQQSVFS
jgi:hypothetical protein